MRKTGKPIPSRHRSNYLKLLALHLSGQLKGKDIPPELKETEVYIRRNHRGSEEFWTLKQMQEDRHPKGTGYGEEEKWEKLKGPDEGQK